LPRQEHSYSLTPELGARICAIVREGASITVAGACCGIPVVICRKWLRTGERLCREKRRGRQRDFLEAINRAEAMAVVDILRNIVAASQKSWQAAAWLLERRFPAEFGKAERAKTGNPDKEDNPPTFTWQQMLESIEETNDSIEFPRNKPFDEKGQD
jgi:hypothetical protein